MFYLLFSQVSFFFFWSTTADHQRRPEAQGGHSTNHTHHSRRFSTFESLNMIYCLRLLNCELIFVRTYRIPPWTLQSFFFFFTFFLSLLIPWNSWPASSSSCQRSNLDRLSNSTFELWARTRQQTCLFSATAAAHVAGTLHSTTIWSHRPAPRPPPQKTRLMQRMENKRSSVFWNPKSTQSTLQRKTRTLKNITKK